ncbi:MAG: hypothetical protein KAG43_04450 [Candidatus Marithrix sp.]|nr:hypothetical protein [Candidatus Marithrix sp.]
MQSKIPLLLMGFFVLILSAITIGFLFTIEQVGQEYKQIQTAVLQGDKTAIGDLENADIETQKQILADEDVSQAVANIYLKDVDNFTFQKLKVYDSAIENIILADAYPVLIAHYKPKIQTNIEHDNFDEAVILLDILKSKYPNSQELAALATIIKDKKQQRLAVLTEQYTACLEQTLETLLDRINCVATTRKKIMQIGASLPTADPSLQAMYVEGINYAIAEKDYQQAEKLLSDWSITLPSASKEREQLQHNLSLYEQHKEITADLGSYDRDKIINRLQQLVTAKELQSKLFSIPKVRNNLLRYHIDEALELIILKDNVKVNTKTIVLLEQLLNVARNSKQHQTTKTSTPWYNNPTKTAKPKISRLLQQCQQHFKANRLTTGKSGTALSCYHKVLKQDFGNLDAKAGLKAIAKRYQSWAKKALQQNQFSKAKSYIASLEKVSPGSEAVAVLKRSLKKASGRKKPKTVKTKINVKPIVKKPVEKKVTIPEKTVAKPVKKVESCSNCSCSKLLKQLSMGVRPLTKVQKSFFQSKCR